MGKKFLVVDPWVLVVERAERTRLFVKQFSLSGFLGRKEANEGSCIEGIFKGVLSVRGLENWLERGALQRKRIWCIPRETK